MTVEKKGKSVGLLKTGGPGGYAVVVGIRIYRDILEGGDGEGQSGPSASVCLWFFKLNFCIKYFLKKNKTIIYSNN